MISPKATSTSPNNMSGKCLISKLSGMKVSTRPPHQPLLTSTNHTRLCTALRLYPQIPVNVRIADKTTFLPVAADPMAPLQSLYINVQVLASLPTTCIAAKRCTLTMRTASGPSDGSLENWRKSVGATSLSIVDRGSAWAVSTPSAPGLKPMLTILL